MAYPQFGYPTAASSLASSQLLSMSAGSTPQTSVSTSCCETGRPIMTDPQTGQTICSCQYSSSLLSYPRVASLSESVYGSAYATQGYVPFGTDPSAFYSPLNPAYDLKESNEAWRSLAHPTPCYPYDPTGMAAGYPYGQSALAQRKNATREATSTLKAWLQEHIKNPYPTKGEKIMLAIITKMTLTQVSTWFANARRRLKKENKMTWSPRNRSDEDGNRLDSDDEDGDPDSKDNNGNHDSKDQKDSKDSKDDDRDSLIDAGREQDLNVCGDDADDLSDLKVDVDDESGALSSTTPSKPGLPGLPSLHGGSTTAGGVGQQSSCMNPSSQTNVKPRIWSIADVATSNSSTSPRGVAPSSGGLQSTGGHHAHLGSPVPLMSNTSPPSVVGALSHKLDTGSSTDPAYRPTNGFRPWVNGSTGVSSLYGGHTVGGHGHSPTSGHLSAVGAGGSSGGSGSGQNMVASPPGAASTTPGAGLLRPYALAPRTEVH